MKRKIKRGAASAGNGHGSLAVPQVPDFGRLRSLVLLSVALIVVTFAVYWQTGNNEFLNYDDNDYVTGNLHVTTGLTFANIVWAFTSIDVSNWHPMTWLSHMLDAELYGTVPRGHHLTNVIIHTEATLLLFLLLSCATKAFWQSSFVSAVFALHPLHVESVAWVAERKDVLSAFFCFLTLLLYVFYVRKQKKMLYVFSLVSFALGLMSKPMLVTVPFIMLLLDYWPLDRYRPREKGRVGSATSLLVEKIPFLACSLFSAAITIYAQHAGGAIKGFDEIPVLLRLENAVTAYAKYLFKTLWPQDLAIMYPFPSSIPAWEIIGSLLVLLLVSAATIHTRRRHPYLMVGWFWFLLTLVPVIGLVQVGDQSMADRYTYIPFTGLFIMVAWGIPPLTEKWRCRAGFLATFSVVVLAALAVVTFHQLAVWRDDISTFRHALRVTPLNYIAHIKLGEALGQKRDTSGEIAEYQAAVRLRPNHPLGHNRLGVAVARNGEQDRAVAEFRTALALDPDYIEARSNLGYTLFKQGDPDAALREFERALALKPTYAMALNGMGIALAEKGQLDAAIRKFQEALEANPNLTAAYDNLERARSQTRREAGP